MGSVVEMSRKAMDPDRFQMRAIKRQIIQLEKAMYRAEARIRSLQGWRADLAYESQETEDE